jgi:hypothetical protein
MRAAGEWALAAVLMAFCASAYGQSPELLARCRAKPPGIREACLEAIKPKTKPAKTGEQLPRTASPPSDQPAAAIEKPRTRRVALDPPHDVAKVVDAADLGVGTRKYMNIELEVQGVKCYYADVEDYRCTAPEANVTFFTRKIIVATGTDYLEKYCDTLKRALQTDNCIVSIRFQYSSQEVEQDLISGFQERTVIRPREIALVPQRQ